MTAMPIAKVIIRIGTGSITPITDKTITVVGKVSANTERTLAASNGTRETGPTTTNVLVQKRTELSGGIGPDQIISMSQSLLTHLVLADLPLTAKANGIDSAIPNAPIPHLTIGVRTIATTFSGVHGVRTKPLVK